MKNKILIACSLIVIAAFSAFAIRGYINYQAVAKDTNLQNVVERFEAIPTAGVTIVQIAISGVTNNVKNSNRPTYQYYNGVTASFTQPPYPMTVQVVVSSNTTGNVYVSGIDARNNLIISKHYFHRGGTIESKQAFARIDAVSFSPSFSASFGANDAVSINIGRMVGLSNPIMNWDNVYKVNYQTAAWQTPIDAPIVTNNVNVSGNFGMFDDSTIDQPLATFLPPITGVSTSVTVWYRQSDQPLR